MYMLCILEKVSELHHSQIQVESVITITIPHHSLSKYGGLVLFFNSDIAKILGIIEI